MQKISLDDYINPTSEGSPSAFTKHWKNMKLSQFGKEFPTAFDI
jgi:aspartyl/asparaginyl beta-hydroxylase (cupin superfamily)